MKSLKHSLKHKEASLPPLQELQVPLKRWFESELGQQLLAAEQRQLDLLLPKLFGYHLLQISACACGDLTQGSPAGHRFTLVADTDIASDAGDQLLVGELDNLPLANDCIDAVVLHHALDFARSPHHVLREAVRVLRPGGRLVVVGFNPLSLWGLHRLRRRRKGEVPWQGHFMTSWRVHDWLTLLEMKSERVSAGFYRPPWRSARWMERMQFLERWGERSHSFNGAFWILSACKESYVVTPLARRWRRRFVFPLPVAQSSRAGRQSGSEPARIYRFEASGKR